MSDRDVKVCITLKAYQIETVREWFARAGELPNVAHGYALAIKDLLSKDEASPEDGEELARLVQGLHDDARNAMLLRNALRDVLQTAIIHDPEGRKGPLQ